MTPGSQRVNCIYFQFSQHFTQVTSHTVKITKKKRPQHIFSKDYFERLIIGRETCV